MLPIYTSAQLKDGIQSGDLMLDLSEYMKKKDGEALTSKVDELEVALGAKLDASPQHKHQIDDIKQLEVALGGKYDKGEKYPHNQILSDVEKIAYIEAPELGSLKLSDYTFYVDDKSGDLMITRGSASGDILIGTYYVASGKWSWEQEQAPACSCETALEALESRVDNHTHKVLTSGESSSLTADASTLRYWDPELSEGESLYFQIGQGHNNPGGALWMTYTYPGQMNLKFYPNGNVGMSMDNVQQRIKFNGTCEFQNDVTVNGQVNAANKFRFGKSEFHATTDDYTIHRVNGVDWWSCNNLNNYMKVYKNLDVDSNLNVDGDLSVKGTDILAKITEMENILKNHYDALLMLCQKHGMVDNNTSDGDKITPQ